MEFATRLYSVWATNNDFFIFIFVIATFYYFFFATSFGPFSLQLHRRLIIKPLCIHIHHWVLSKFLHNFLILCFRYMKLCFATKIPQLVSLRNLYLQDPQINWFILLGFCLKFFDFYWKCSYVLIMQCYKFDPHPNLWFFLIKLYM